ncbi:uncharacterized protein LOC135216258 [Macrobrachium nipponense]|uniref:uncharacterized protein LOC135216258 n=1 Tax=Macrobrachium nipponense TaxID=159736 RepID=UPI0030C7D489
MKAFEKDFIVNAEPHVHPNMIAWTLELQEKVRRMRTRSRNQSRTGADSSSTIRKYIYHNRAFNLLEEVKRGIPIYNSLDVGPDKFKKTHISLGTDRNLIPRLSNLKVSVKNAPIESENPKLQDFRFSEVEMQVSSPSVFHLYLDLVEKRIIKDLPPWLLAMRSRGSTQVNSLYS